MAGVRVERKPPELFAEKMPSDKEELFDFASRWNAVIKPIGDRVYVEIPSSSGDPVNAEPGNWVVRDAFGKVERLNQYRFERDYKVRD